jgi:hypothetical protein
MPSNLRMEQSKFRKHPRAEKYINGLNQTLGSIWREVDMAGVLAPQESFGALNAGRKPAKYKVGDYVYTITNPKLILMVRRPKCANPGMTPGAESQG